MSGDLVNINNFCCDPVVPEKMVKLLRNYFFGPDLNKKGVIMGHAQNEKQFFWAEITKPDYQLSETLFYQNIICFG